MTDVTDLEDLISKTALGNRAAFSALYNATSAKLFGICLRILNNRSEAEEVLQETYVKVWRSAGSFVIGKASPITWLATIARNTSIDRYRKRRPELAELSEVEDFTEDLPSPEAVAVLSDDVRRLDNCMGELKETHADAVRQIYLGGWTYEEAAEKLGSPAGTVKTWVRRSLVSLRECMNR